MFLDASGFHADSFAPALSGRKVHPVYRLRFNNFQIALKDAGVDGENGPCEAWQDFDPPGYRTVTTKLDAPNHLNGTPDRGRIATLPGQDRSADSAAKGKTLSGRPDPLRGLRFAEIPDEQTNCQDDIEHDA
jgi:hypothetical protein